MVRMNWPRGGYRALLAALVVLLGLTACDELSAPVVTGGADNGAASAYCAEQGGRVIMRTPVYGTNRAEAAQLALREPVAFCNFESPEPNEPGSDFHTQVEIDLVSLYSERPTLALLAYLESAPPDTSGFPVSANPSFIHCDQLGGAIIFGPSVTGSGGGWVKAADDTTNAFDIITPCVFADGSAIDSWPITYRATGTIRGVPLETVVRYQPDGAYPPIYGPTP